MKDKSCDRLKKALSLRNMKQSELAKKTGISKSALSQYVSGTIEPRQTNVHLLSKALNVSEAWLMGFDVPIERENKNNPISQLTKEEKFEYDKFMNDAVYFFNDDSISNEDKKKLLDSLNDVFFEIMNDKNKKK